MPSYKYLALDANGRKTRATIQAENIKQARTTIKNQGLYVTEIAEVQTRAKSTEALFASAPAFTRSELAIWTRQFASLIGAGLSIERSLQSLGEEAYKPKLQALLGEVAAQVKAGTPLSAALASFPTEFSSIYTGVIAAGEKSGSLPEIMDSLASDLEAAQVLKSKVVGAALYPAIVSAIAVLIVVFLMVYVLPQVAQAFAGSKQQLPLLTEIMLATSGLLQKYWIAIAAIFVSVITLTKLALRNKATLLKADSMMLGLPVIGALITNYNAARFASTLGMLANAGVPILDALAASSKTVSNSAMRSDITDIQTMVKEGAPLGAAIGSKSSLPKLVATFAKIGGETGELGKMMANVGNQLSEGVQRRAVALASALEPILILTMGLVVMLIVLAVLMPIIEMNNLVT